EHREQLETVAEKLLEVETLDAAQIKSLFETGEMPAEPETVSEIEDVEEVLVQKEESEETEEPKTYDEIKETVEDEATEQEETKESDAEEDAAEDKTKKDEFIVKVIYIKKASDASCYWC